MLYSRYKDMKLKNQKQIWYTPGEFFDENYLELYRKIIPQERTIKEVDFIERCLNLKPGMKILDLACGYGRHTIEFARRGYKMVGQDINSLFLNEAKKEAKKAKIKIDWVESDMRLIPFKNEFDVVLNLFTSFGYLETDKDHQKVIFEIAKSLKIGGFFFLDIHNREEFVCHYHPKETKNLPDSSTLIFERNFDFVTGRINEQRVWIKKNNQKIEKFLSFRQFTLVELISMCGLNGLVFKESYGDYNGDPLSFNTKRCILVVQKTPKLL